MSLRDKPPVNRLFAVLAESARKRSQIYHSDPGRYWRELETQVILLSEFEAARNYQTMSNLYS
jgi:hypothetical protein